MRISPYFRLMRLDRPVGTLLLLWPTLAALWLAAGGLPSPPLLVIFVVGTFLMRSAGCVINDIADRKVDGHVERTRNRPLAIGEVGLRAAVVLFVLLCLGAASLLVFLNDDTRLLAIAGLGIAVLYPFLKRWTNLPQLGLSVAFSWGILMAFTAVGDTAAGHFDMVGGGAQNGATPVGHLVSENAGRTSWGRWSLAAFIKALGQIPFAGWVLFAASAVWILAYDTLYAMTDRKDDIQVGVKSTAVLLGRLDRPVVAALQAGTLVGFAAVGVLYGFGWRYVLGLAAILGLFVYQQSIIRERQPAACFKAFLNNTWVGFSLFAATFLEVTF